MQKKIFGNLFLFLIGILIFTSCAKDTKVYPAPTPIDTTLKISYKDTIQPIFTKGCLGSFCHSGSVAPNLTVGNSYNALMSGNFVNTTSPNQSEVYIEMAPGGGMSSHCTEAEANLVLEWIKRGALNN